MNLQTMIGIIDKAGYDVKKIERDGFYAHRPGS
jgi:hypothetical protein